MTFGVDAYTSEAYLRAERDKLWCKVWLQVGRVEDLPEVGSYLTYDILDDSIIVVRTGPDAYKAFYNVCTHRGRKLIDTPPGATKAIGQRPPFVCPFPCPAFTFNGYCHPIPAQACLECAPYVSHTQTSH